MGRQCPNCGKELKDSAKFCGECGNKCEEVVNIKSEGHVLEEGKIKKNIEKLSSGIIKVESLVSDSLDKGKEKFNKYQDMSDEEKMEKKQRYIDSAKVKSKEFVSDVKSFKRLPKKKKKKVILVLCGILVLFFVFLPISGKKGMKSLSAEEQIELAKNAVIDYLPAEELLSSGGVAHVLWVFDEGYVIAARDGIKFRFSVNSDGIAYFEGAEKNGDEISPEALNAVWEQYYEIGRLSGTL